MNNRHLFEANLEWPLVENNKISTSLKSHRIHINGKEDLHVSAAKTFKGDPTMHNPEDLLLSSLMSCHMMSYLYLCTKQKIEIISYSDNAIAVLETFMDGSGKIIEVTLNPIVKLHSPDQINAAKALHMDAHKLCFIANSCNFKININPLIKSCD